MRYTWKRVTSSQVVSNTPAWLSGVILTSDTVGNADITLYDGESTSDPTILTVRAAQFQTKVINFQPYMETQRGLYISIGSNVQEVLVQLVWEHE